ncbi:hypothetical protein CYMTET_5738 [Cymbomonas tetramitiformis]|uniref:Uncharacterized protein n=1 Tax=Cymbomonas tetramitiformis TaxID=36881 RepID=A0AAE0GYH6_9CHLO|nr:hypothetical protein CYMTET_5738 [Cymbomonas tetramitiformis]
MPPHVILKQLHKYLLIPNGDDALYSSASQNLTTLTAETQSVKPKPTCKHDSTEGTSAIFPGDLSTGKPLPTELLANLDVSEEVEQKLGSGSYAFVGTTQKRHVLTVLKFKDCRTPWK